MTSLWLPRRAGAPVKPVKVEFTDDSGQLARTYTFDRSLQLGYGDRCEVRLAGEHGPEVVCRLERSDSPVRLWIPVSETTDGDRIEILVDGNRVDDEAVDIHPGSHVELVDPEGHRYSLQVERPPPWYLNAHNLVWLLAVLAAAAAGTAGYFYTTLRETQVSIERTHSELRDVERRIASTSVETDEALRELRTAQAQSAQQIRGDFNRRLTELATHAEDELARVSEIDEERRAELQRDMRVQLKSLRDELGDRMVSAYQHFRQVEERFKQSLATKMAEVEIQRTQLQQLFHAARETVLFFHTRYDVEFVRTGQIKTQHEFGTGFFVSPQGLALTAQHVVYPWHYDQDLQVLLRLELARVHADTVAWDVWGYTTQIVSEGASIPDGLNFDSAWRSGNGSRGLRLLHTAPLVLSDVLVESPVGVVPVRMPQPGGGDVAVLQVARFEQPGAALEISDHPTATLDEVLVIGYPLSRLSHGKAEPQAVSGFVRRTSGTMLELNTALNPGISGAPILARDGRVIGMAVGILGSDVYGLGVPATDLASVLGEARRNLAKEEERLHLLGCDAGEIDGVFDARTWDAYRCADAKRESGGNG